jgi:putative molybdopterin biosynthesis protein
MRRGIYLDNTPLKDALREWFDNAIAKNILPLEGETVKAGDSLGRVTAEAVFAKISAPFYHSSAMDGYAVRFVDTFGSTESLPKRLRVGDEAIYVDTGNPIPDGFNAVIMIEDVNIVKKEDKGQGAEGNVYEYIEIIQSATPWQHVRVIGEDVVSSELILPENHEIRPIDIGAVISGGHVDIRVRRKPRVAIIPTGSELVDPGSELKKGNIIEYNSIILSSLVRQWGAEAVRFKPVPDDLDHIKQSILDGCDKSDVIIVNAGSSAGSEDFTAQAIAELGKIILHGVNIKPGKPVILGWVDTKPVIGIPGYPVSTYITFNLFAKKLIYHLQGLDVPEPDIIRARLSRQIASSLGQEEFLRVKVGKVGDNVIASPVSRGAGVLMSLVRADGFVRIPAMSEGLAAGADVEVELIRERKEISNTVVCIGSHDISLDLLANVFKKRHPNYSLSSAHIGSMGGLIALKRGEAHLVGTHLLDEETGEYNVPFIKRLLPDMKVLVMNMVYRRQGFMVVRGNPKNIQNFRDLTKDEVVFINRQRGSGTRLLTDKYLSDNGISPEDVKGYDREEYTHMGVASAVLTGIADAGIGILAAASALGLDFIPVADERYDIVVAKDNVDSGAVSALLDIITDDEEFKSLVEGLGGYDVSSMGRIMYET